MIVQMKQFVNSSLHGSSFLDAIGIGNGSHLNTPGGSASGYIPPSFSDISSIHNNMSIMTLDSVAKEGMETPSITPIRNTKR